MSGMVSTAEANPPVPSGSQVFTPSALAEAMIGALGRTNACTWLEPSVGEGAFLNAMRSYGCDAESVTGLELDESLSALAPRFGSLHYGVEALGWMKSTQQKFDVVVGNPPYVSLSDVASEIQKAACSVTDPLGNRLRISANLWSAFVSASVDVLADGGAIGFVLPASWDYADYARVLRHELPLLFETFHVYRSERPLFKTVLEGSVVILGTGFRKPHRYTARIECTDLDSVCRALDDFQPSLGPSGARHSSDYQAPGGAQLRDFLTIRLGGVTGDAGYFTLSEERRRALGLPAAALRRIVSRARHLKWSSLGRLEWESLRDDGQKVWLFRPTESSASMVGVREYLQRDASQGGCNRESFKVSNREPWYQTPLPSRIDAFLSGMASRGPRLTFREFTGLTATNTLYVVAFKRSLDAGRRRNIALQLLSEPVLAQLAQVQRRYAGGLKKFEPSDLLGLRVEKPARPVGEAEYREVFERSSAIE